eukprot:12022816-Karenia_brevis.AAC.1
MLECAGASLPQEEALAFQTLLKKVTASLAAQQRAAGKAPITPLRSTSPTPSVVEDMSMGLSASSDPYMPARGRKGARSVSPSANSRLKAR